MIISRRFSTLTDKDNNFAQNAYRMADSMITYMITTGIFVFLVGILFGARAKRYRSGYKASMEGQAAE